MLPEAPEITGLLYRVLAPSLVLGGFSRFSEMFEGTY